MSSYNNIEKIKYASPDCVVTLQEYIVFENERAEEKYVVFKFSNNVSQQLLGMEFEVSQYDIDGNLIEKSIVIYNKFLSKPNAAFVPNAKLKVNFAFKTLSVRLVQAAFDRFLWKEGAYLDNSYKFEHYAADRDTERPRAAAAPAEQPVKVNPPKKKKGELPFKIKNSTRKNIPKFPGILNFIICAIVIAGIGVSMYLFSKDSTSFTIDNFDVKIVSEGEKTVAVTGYRGEETDISVPEILGEYTVIRINKNAFKNSDVETVEFKTDLYIEGYAFDGCENLKEVSSSYSVSVTENAFYNCTSLTTVLTPDAFLYSGCFTGCTGLTFLSFNATDAVKLSALFGGAVPQKTPFIICPNLPSGFYN